MAVSVQVLTSGEAGEDLLASVHTMLLGAFRGDFAPEDWEHSVGGQHVVAVDGDHVVAHAAVVRRTIHVAGQPWRAGYVEGVGTAPDRQREGVGALVMDRATDLVRDGYDLGVLSTDRHAFYERLGWERWHGPTYVRAGQELVRTADEDDGVMVLRTGPTATLDLDATISCDQRPGDDW